MMPTPSQVGAFVLKCFGCLGELPVKLLRPAWIASLSMAQILLELLKSRLVPDIRRLKEASLRKYEAKADAVVARTQKLLAEAAEASNRATLHKRKDAFAHLELARKKADVDKTQAETDAIRLTAIADATTTLLEAISQLRQYGGDVSFSEDNLRKVLSIGPPPDDTDKSEIQVQQERSDGAAENRPPV